jgi:hypothetical protein
VSIFKVVSNPWLLLFLTLTFSWTRAQWLNGKLEVAEMEKSSLQSQISHYAEINRGTIESFNLAKDAMQEATQAFLHKENHDATAVASLDQAITDLGEMLNGTVETTEIDCGNERLPTPVIDRMWEHYGTKGDNQGSDRVPVPPDS